MKKKLPYIIGIVLVVIGVVLWLVLSNLICSVNDCNKFTQAGSEYCQGHTCCLDNCTKYKETNATYCYDIHGCRYDGCSALVTESDGTLHYCVEHKCGIDGCSVEKSIGNYCFQHICTYSGCDTSTSQAFSRCPKHKE